MAPVRLRGGKRFAFASQCKVKVHSTAVCAVSREKYDLVRLAVGVRNVRNVRIVRTGRMSSVSEPQACTALGVLQLITRWSGYWLLFA